jgi:copper chaperone
MEQLNLTIEGMTCEHCVHAVNKRLSTMAGVKVEEVLIGSARIRHDPAVASLEQIEDAIADEGYTAEKRNG